MSKRLTVFLSSTQVDLSEVRQNVIKFLKVLDPDILAMEVFGSDESEPVDYCLEKVRACSVFVGIYAERYGSIDPNSGKSVTELEYLEAQKMLETGRLQGLLLYLIHPEANWPLNLVQRNPEGMNKLQNFKRAMQRDHTVSFFRAVEDLPLLVLKDVIRKIGFKPGGRPFGSRRVRSVKQRTSLDRPVGMEYYAEDLGGLFFGRDIELEALVTQVVVHRVSLLIGASGVGKSSLLRAGLVNRVKGLGWQTALVRPLTEPIQNLRRFLWDQLVQGNLPPEFDLSSVLRTAAIANKGRRLLVIIDQFEDVLLARNPHDIETLTRDFLSLFGMPEDNLHIVISYRGDVESRVGTIWQRISGSPQGLPRTYIGPLQRQAARYVLDSSLMALGVRLKDTAKKEPPLSDVVISDLEAESLLNGYAGVYPPFVQMVVARIFQEKDNDSSYRPAKYYAAGRSRRIISDFLMNQLKYLGRKVEAGKKVLIALVSSYGTKTQKSLEEIATETLLPARSIENTLASLIDLRLVRDLDGTYEISHDFLAGTITSELVSANEREAKKYKEVLRSRAAAYTATKAILTKAEHLYIYRFRNTMLCTEEEIKLLFLSYLSGTGPISYWAKRVPKSKLKGWALEFVSDSDLQIEQAASRFLIRLGEPPRLPDLADVFSDYKDQHELSRYIVDFATVDDIGLLVKLNRKKAEEIVDASRRSLVRLVKPFALSYQTGLQEILLLLSSSKNPKTIKTFEAVSLGLGEILDLSAIREGLRSDEPWRKLFCIDALSVKGGKTDLSELQNLLLGKATRRLRAAATKSIVRLALKLGESEILNRNLFSNDESTVLETLSAVDIPSDLVTVATLMPLYDKYPEEVSKAIYRVSVPSDLPQLKGILSRLPLEPPAREIVYAVCKHGHEDEFSFLFQLFLNYDGEIKFWNPFSVVDRVSDLATVDHLPQLEKIVQASDFWTYYKEKDRPEPKIPVKDYGNVYFVKRLAGTAFGKIATRKEFPLIFDMLEHDYWIIRNAALTAIKKYGTVDDIETLVQKALESESSAEGLIEAIRAIDDRTNAIENHS